MEILLVGTGVALLVAMVGWSLVTRRRAGSKANSGLIIPPGVSLIAQPLLTEVEAFVYNLMRLAVQDEYFVFAQVPLWCLVQIQAQDSKARSQLLSRIALKRVDFVLVHPGTRAVEKVVELDEPYPPSSQRQERDRLVESVLHAAGIKVVRLKAQKSYTVPALAKALGMAPEE